MKRIKDFLTIILFGAVIFGFSVAFAITPDTDISKAERRKLKNAPEVTVKSVMSKSFSEELEEYFLDQFPKRDWFRKVNDNVRVTVLGQRDVNGLWTMNGSIFKHEGDLKPDQVKYGSSVINRVIKTNLSGMNVYYSVIPDKNYYIKGVGNHPEFDYESLLKILDENIKGAEYIDIFGELDLYDYYRTDTHWTQDKIFPVVEKLADAMGMKENLTPMDDYKKNELYPFYGVYWGQAALGEKPDTLKYLTSFYTENAKVSGIDPEILERDFGVKYDLSDKVYSLDRFDGLDGYDVFLSGAQPIVTIECEDAKTDRELVIFRDSYGSSIAPLFTGAYKKITLIDLRYIPTMLLGQFVEFKEGGDVLFLYSTSLLNSSMLMR